MSSILRRFNHSHAWNDPARVRHDASLDLAWTQTSEAGELLQKVITSPPSQHIHHPNMLDYLHGRMEHAGSSSSRELSPSAQRMLSSLLTYPLTLSHAVRTVFNYDHVKPHLNILIIGARAESSLPQTLWKEVLYSQSAAQHVTITMVGPGQLVAQSKASSQKQQHQRHQHKWNDQEITIHRGQHTDVLHELPEAFDLLRSADLFALFHPGFGHAKMQSMWMPTLDLLFQTRKPIFCTAYSPDDLQRDMESLRSIAQQMDEQELGESLEFIHPPKNNPFASTKASVTDEGEVTVTNFYSYVFQAKPVAELPVVRSSSFVVTMESN